MTPKKWVVNIYRSQIQRKQTKEPQKSENLHTQSVNPGWCEDT